MKMTMADSAVLAAQLKRKYPLPEPDAKWVEDCVNALIDDGQTPSLAAVEEQYLYSDLSVSTVPSRVLPSEAHNKVLFPSPVMVQLQSVTEIGSSAFQLQTVLEQRRDVLEGATRILRMDEEAPPDGQAEVGGDKLPAYPRGMLRMQVSDGRRVMAAVEYRRIEALRLGETALGAKLALHNVRVLRGTLLLTPENTQVLGYQVDHLEAEQPRLFVNSLLKRLGKPEATATSPATTPPTATTRGTAPALLALLAPRRAPTTQNANARVANASTAAASMGVGLAARRPGSTNANAVALQSGPESSAAAQARARAIAAAAMSPEPAPRSGHPKRKAPPASTTASTVNPAAGAAIDSRSESVDSRSKRPRGRPRQSTVADTSEYDVSVLELDEAVLQDLEKIEEHACASATASAVSAASAQHAFLVDSDEDEFGVDESFFRHVDDAVAHAHQIGIQSQSQSQSHGVGTSHTVEGNGTSWTRGSWRVATTVGGTSGTDEGDEEKENRPEVIEILSD